MTRIVTPFEGTGLPVWTEDEPPPSPLRLYRTAVPAEWVDYNGHMSESAYLLAFGHSSDAFFRFIGIDEDYRSGGHSLFTVETHIHNVAQARQGDEVVFDLAVLDLDSRRVHILHTMRAAVTSAEIAVGEQLLVHVDTEAQASTPLPAELTRRLDALRRAHAALPRPAFLGRPIGIRRG